MTAAFILVSRTCAGCRKNKFRVLKKSPQRYCSQRCQERYCPTDMRQGRSSRGHGIAISLIENRKLAKLRRIQRLSTYDPETDSVVEPEANPIDVDVPIDIPRQ